MSGSVYDVIVVGAGVVGALTARELARYDLRVLVLEAEADAAMGATKANSAIVHGGFAEGSDTLKGRLCIAGRRAFPQLEQELNFGFRVTGSLVVSFEPDPWRLEELRRRGLDNGLDDLELWSGARARAHEPHLNPAVTGALWCAGAGVCSPWDLAYAALENAVAHGAELRLGCRVEAVEGPFPGAQRWRLQSAGKTFETRYVVNAAGLGSGFLDALAGASDSAVHPRTGEYLVFGAGTGSLVKSVIFQLPGPMGKGVLVGPTYQNNLLIGPDARNEDPEPGTDLRHTHAERLAALVAQASAVVDGIDLKKAIRSFTGVRAAVAGGDFLVGPADPKRLPGWHRAAGIQSPGLTASPAIARLLVEGLAREGLSLVPRTFDPGRRPLSAHLSRRAPLLPFAEVDALTKRPDGDPERVVCRCEQVRERDLEEAVSRGLPITTVDALKRRTRAGMGWCQGNFCRPRVATWLEGRLGVPVSPVDDVTRSGVHRVEGRDLVQLGEGLDQSSSRVPPLRTPAS